MLWTEARDRSGWFDLWRELERLNRNMNRWRWASGDESVVTTEVAGIDPEAIEISVAGRSLTLKGKRSAEDLKEGEAYHRRERWNGSFSKTVELPFAVDVEKVNAVNRRGILYITLPRADEEKPRKVEIKGE